MRNQSMTAPPWLDPETSEGRLLARIFNLKPQHRECLEHAALELRSGIPLISVGDRGVAAPLELLR